MRSLSTPRLLVIDDEPDAGRILSKILSEQGFVVKTAASGEEGLKIVEKEALDLVLLDVVLPPWDGVETLRRIKRARPSIPVIMMTGFETVKTAVEAMKCGAHDYLAKPLPIDRLPTILRQAIQVQAMERSSPSKVPVPIVPVTPEEMVGQHLSVVAIFDLVRRIAPEDVTVLIQGESGTGKELIAHALHSLSPRSKRPFAPVDCASLPESLFESELFGYERGAFTGAESTKEGRFEQAQGGTLFLDEVGNLSLTAQAKLLRVLQEKEITRLGGKSPIKIDVRILTATNQDLEGLMTKGLFREDLFHRLDVFSIHLPPLRHRQGDVKLLTRFFLDRFNKELGMSKRIRSISDEVLTLLEAYSWPGNVRELGNVIKSALLLADEVIFPEHLPEKVLSMRLGQAGSSPAVSESKTAEKPPGLREASRRSAQGTEKQLILRTLRETRGNKRAAAKLLGIDYKTLFNKLKSLGITKEEVEAMKYSHV